MSENQLICLCCFGKINSNSNQVILKCDHSYHYGCFVSMIEYEKKFSFNNCPSCKKDLDVPFYVSKEVKKKNNGKCSICLEKLGYNFNIYETDCKHFFHNKCIDQWIKLKKNCPLCRTSLKHKKINNDNIFIEDIPELHEPENFNDLFINGSSIPLINANVQEPEPLSIDSIDNPRSNISRIHSFDDLDLEF